MVQGPMQFGTTNNAGDSPTELTSAALTPTLTVRNTAGRNSGVYALQGIGNYAGAAGNGGVYGLVASGFPPAGSTDPGTGVIASGQGYGVMGLGGQIAGVFGQSSAGLAGSFAGNVSVTGTLTKGGGGFKIDHPLDPANKYLSHSFVEAPERLNVYSGTVSTDADGVATVTLPEYFDALNTDCGTS